MKYLALLFVLCSFAFSNAFAENLGLSCEISVPDYEFGWVRKTYTSTCHTAQYGCTYEGLERSLVRKLNRAGHHWQIIKHWEGSVDWKIRIEFRVYEPVRRLEAEERRIFLCNELRDCSIEVLQAGEIDEFELINRAMDVSDCGSVNRTAD